jgi:hypothetical protein
MPGMLFRSSRKRGTILIRSKLTAGLFALVCAVFFLAALTPTVSKPLPDHSNGRNTSNEASIRQLDGESTVIIEQSGNTSQVDYTQNGLQNEVWISQTGFHAAEVIQDGSGNSATIIQKQSKSMPAPVFPPGRGNPPPFSDGNGTAGSSIAYIEQVGDDNIITLEQTGSHSAWITQEGQGHVATVTQTGTSGNGIPFDPPGKGNPDPPPFRGDQSAGSVAVSYQQGLKNELVLNQEGSHFAEINQTGEKNNAIVNQIYNAPGKEGAQAVLTQEGMKNIARIDQFGGGHSALLTQNGNGNNAIIQQQKPAGAS